MALVTWDLCQPAGRRWQGAATGVAAGIKLVPLLFVAYLVLTRRFRQAAVAARAFAVTVAAGFAALPSASVTWWLGGDFLQAGRTGFVGGQQNQSLRGLVTRLAGSVAGGTRPWLVLAVLVGGAGLAAAVTLHRRGYPLAGLLTCALTGLLVSPISWDHHWVWLAPGLALLADAGTRAAGRRPPRLVRAGGRAWRRLRGLARLLAAGRRAAEAAASSATRPPAPGPTGTARPTASTTGTGCSCWRATWRWRPAWRRSPSRWAPPAALPAITA